MTVLPCSSAGWNDVFNKLSSRSHVEQQFASCADRGFRVEQHCANLFAKFGSTWVTASDNVVTLPGQPCLESFDLRAFASAIDAVEANKQSVQFSVEEASRLFTLPSNTTRCTSTKLRDAASTRPSYSRFHVSNEYFSSTNSFREFGWAIRRTAQQETLGVPLR